MIHVLDALIVVTSLVLEVVLRTNTQLREVLSLLVVARLWRFVRIIEALQETAEIAMEHKAERVEAQHKKELAELHSELARIKGQLHHRGGPAVPVEVDSNPPGAPSA